MIIVKLIGGLGNQMFQYSVGRYLSDKNKTKLKLDISGFEKYKLHKYSLSHFKIIENIATQEEIAWFEKYKRKNGRKWFLYNKIFSNDKIYVRQKHYHFDPEILNTKSPAYLDGDWVSEKYFEDIENIIRNDFTVKKPSAGKNLEVAEKINTTNSVSIHIRRGDYITNNSTNQYHGACDLDYYREAVSITAKKVPNPYFFIFSDDQKWVKENLKLSYPMYFVDQNNAETNYEDIRLMSMCKHNIIANSTFSWWGAWLNPNKNKMVIAPEKWFNNVPKANTKDVLPKDWIKI